MSEKSSNFVTSLKMISVLLVICVVCGALLALCNDLLYIDDETKFNRAMQKVYPEFDRDASFSETPVAEYKQVAGLGSISKVYRSKDGTYILESTGTGGFNPGGTVSMYVAIGGQTPNVTIKALVITANVGQSWIAKVGQKDLDKAYVGKNIKDLASAQFSAEYKLGGTTWTSTAILNCVKMAVSYCVEGLKLVSTPESEARDAAIALLGDGYTFTTVVNADYTTALGVSFYFTAVKEGAPALDVYVYGDKDSGHQIVALNSELLHADRNSDTAVIAKSEGIDNQLVTKVQGLSLLESQVQKHVATFTHDANGELGELATNPDFAMAEITQVYKSNDGTLVIIASADPGEYEHYEPGTLTMMVIISEGKIVAWEVVSLGDHTYFEDHYGNKDPRAYYGADISAVIPAEISGGATASGDALHAIINLAAYYARSIAE